MRFLCFLFLLVFAGAVIAFAMENQNDVTLKLFNWSFTHSLALVIGVTYILGMLSGWSVVGMVRRSFNRASELLETRQHARAGY